MALERLKLRREQHLHEEAYQQLAEAHAPGSGDVVRRARAAGLPWLNIIQILIQYGPKAIEVLKQIIEALFPDAPEPAPPVVVSTSKPTTGK